MDTTEWVPLRDHLFEPLPPFVFPASDGENRTTWRVGGVVTPTPDPAHGHAGCASHGVPTVPGARTGCAP
ncbi:Tcs6 [Streptomyces tsukubensis]|uniref:Putative lipoprotein n=1 Tax=Streptomyces sp. KCTC 11604BP TaxID=941587 RepID=E9KTJ0_9ACTN|nr:putative lipoprotein [Streptomyces sp. KCTC 11604BP]KAF7459459.1 Tcs6 [Streptomyces tsukubensis]